MSFIDTIKDKLGNIIFPKTVTKAVYDDVSGERLDNTLEGKANREFVTEEAGRLDSVLEAKINAILERKLETPDLPTSLPANGGNADTSKGIVGDDTRSIDSPPSEYVSGGSRHLGVAGIQTEFKFIRTLGVTGFTGNYVIVETKNPWNNSSGGFPIQVAYGDGKPKWRVGTSDTSWGSWQTF